MTDDSVVVVDESKIVTEFLLNTCRPMQQSIHYVQAARQCAAYGNGRWSEDVYSTPLPTGSVAEFYIQPMLSCVGDIDIMHHFSSHLAIPYSHPPPSHLPAEFDSRVVVDEIVDSEYPGYVYLVFSYIITENTDTDKYDAVQYSRSWYETNNHASCIRPTGFEIHGPARTFVDHVTENELSLQVDKVFCRRCLWWPTQAADWPTRPRHYGWPDSATVDHVVSNGCDVVQVAHRLCRQDEWMNKHQWRLSFSRAEIVLINSWMPVQQILYHMLRVFVKTERLTDITDSTGTKMLSNYHIKTLMLWACELKQRSWWIDDLNVVRISVVLLRNLADWVRNKRSHHYFVDNCNLIDTTLQVEIIASQ